MDQLWTLAATWYPDTPKPCRRRFNALTRELAASKRVQLEDRAPYFLKQRARGPNAREESLRS